MAHGIVLLWYDCV